jgi:hypothetical protein
VIGGGWNPAVDGACAPMFTPGQVWTGISRTPPELLAQALTDREDDGPSFRYLTMDEQDERRDTPTISAPPPGPPSEPVTSVENEAPAPLKAIAPPAPGNPFATPPPWWEGSFFQATFNRLEGGFQAVEKATAGQGEILAAIERADRNNTSGWQTTQAQIASFRQEMTAHDAELKALRAEIDQLKTQLTEQAAKLTEQAGMIERLDQRLSEKQANAPARQAPAPTSAAEPA